MRTTPILGAIFLVALIPLFADGQTPISNSRSIDAVAVSPDRFKILLENQHVRVIEYVLLPGQRDEWHTHPPKVSYVVTGGTLRITTEDGESFLNGREGWGCNLDGHTGQALRAKRRQDASPNSPG